MRDIHHFTDFYLHRDPVDMRKQINGLALIVEQEMNADIFKVALFIFTNKRRNTVKIIYWDKSGFALWIKRLEKEKFKWPKNANKEKISLNAEQLRWLLDGYDLSKMKPHQELKYQNIG